MDYLAGENSSSYQSPSRLGGTRHLLGSFGESFVFLSLMFPGTAILITSGALVEVGILDPLTPVLARIVGAVLGDAISFWRAKNSDTKLETCGRFGITCNARKWDPYAWRRMIIK
jgi:membrane protein DedA with SNARE-associated domain